MKWLVALAGTALLVFVLIAWGLHTQEQHQEECRDAGGTVSVKTDTDSRVCIDVTIVEVP